MYCKTTPAGIEIMELATIKIVELAPGIHKHLLLAHRLESCTFKCAFASLRLSGEIPYNYVGIAPFFPVSKVLVSTYINVEIRSCSSGFYLSQHW